MTLLTAIAATIHAPAVQVLVDGLPVTAIAVTIDHGYDVVSSVAKVTLRDVPAWAPFGLLRLPLEIRLGWNGMSITVFKGFVEDDGRAFGDPCSISGAGILKNAQFQHAGDLNYSSQTDTAIVTALLVAAGISSYDVAGAGTTLGTVQAITLRDGAAPFDLINQIDQTLGYHTFDTPSGVVGRRFISGIPGASAAFAYTQGVNIFEMSRPRTVRNIHNYVRVVGIAGATSYRQADNPYIPTPPQYIAYEFRSDVVQTGALADAVAERLMTEVNRVVEEITLTVPGNPYLSPGMTISVLASRVGLATVTPFWLKHVSHALSAQGFYSTLTLEGGVGQEGYIVNLDPHAEFTYTVLTIVASDATVHYAISVDGSASWDPDDAPDTLTYAWTTNKTGTGSGVLWTLELTSADLSPAPTITLTVTDPDGNTDAMTQTIDIAGGAVGVLHRALYVAASAQAEATPNGATWYTWAPGGGATVISTPQVAAGTYSLFGLSNGKLYYTADYLATAPTLVHTFPSAVNCIWINEANPARVLVGTAGGGVWISDNATALAASAWTLARTYSSAVHWIVETGTQGNIWVCTGQDVHITFDGFATDQVQVSFDGTAQTLAMSYFGNYASAVPAVVPVPDCTINYTPKGAASLAASYSNLANPGTNDATLYLAAPTWNATDGWIFGGGNSGLYVPIGPNASYTYFIRFTMGAFLSNFELFGVYSAGHEVRIVPQNFSHQMYWQNGTAAAGPVTQCLGGVLCIAGTHAYRDGIDEGLTLEASSATGSKIAIGGTTNGVAIQDNIPCHVQAFRIYSRLLTLAEIAQVTAEMQAL